MSDPSQSARDYLALRRSLGHKLVMAACLLPRYVEYLDAAGTPAVTVEASLAWSTQTNPGTDMQSCRMMVARGFARYMVGIDPATEIPRYFVRMPKRCELGGWWPVGPGMIFIPSRS